MKLDTWVIHSKGSAVRLRDLIDLTAISDKPMKPLSTDVYPWHHFSREIVQGAPVHHLKGQGRRSTRRHGSADARLRSPSASGVFSDLQRDQITAMGLPVMRSYGLSEAYTFSDNGPGIDQCGLNLAHNATIGCTSARDWVESICSSLLQHSKKSNQSPAGWETKGG